MWHLSDRWAFRLPWCGVQNPCRSDPQEMDQIYRAMCYHCGTWHHYGDLPCRQSYSLWRNSWDWCFLLFSWRTNDRNEPILKETRYHLSSWSLDSPSTHKQVSVTKGLRVEECRKLLSPWGSTAALIGRRDTLWGWWRRKCRASEGKRWLRWRKRCRQGSRRFATITREAKS